MGLHPALGAVQTDNAEPQLAGAAGEGALVQFVEGGAVLRVHQQVDGAAAHGVEVRRLDHAQAGGIHVQKQAVGGDDLDALRFVFDDGAQSCLAGDQGLLRLALGADVVGDADEADEVAVSVAQRRLAGEVGACDPAGGEHFLGGDGAVGGQRTPVPLADQVGAAGLENRGVVPPEHLRRRLADEPGGAFVEEQVASFKILDVNGVRNAVGDAAQQRFGALELLLGELSLGDVDVHDHRPLGGAGGCGRDREAEPAFLLRGMAGVFQGKLAALAGQHLLQPLQYGDCLRRTMAGCAPADLNVVLADAVVGVGQVIFFCETFPGPVDGMNDAFGVQKRDVRGQRIKNGVGHLRQDVHRSKNPLDFSWHWTVFNRFCRQEMAQDEGQGEIGTSGDFELGPDVMMIYAQTGKDDA